MPAASADPIPGPVHVATVCRACAGDQPGLAAGLRTAFGRARLPVELREGDCMSGCARPVALAFRAPGKTAYLFGDVTVSDIPEILVFARLYVGAQDGVLTDARPIGQLRLKAIARIPG